MAEPSRAQRVQDIAQQWVGTTFVEKNSDYGNSYIVAGETIKLWFPDGINLDTQLKMTFFQLLTRMLDKLMRVSNLILRGKENKVSDEKAYQTIADNGVYSFMAAEICLNGVLPPEVSPAQPPAPRHDVHPDLGQEGGPTKGQP